MEEQLSCYLVLLSKPGNKTAAPPWPDPNVTILHPTHSPFPLSSHSTHCVAISIAICTDFMRLSLILMSTGSMLCTSTLVTTYSRQNGMLTHWGKSGRQCTDKIFKCITLNENLKILNEISLKYVPQVLIDNMAVLVQLMACRQTCDKPLSEAMLVCCTDAYMRQPQWVNSLTTGRCGSNFESIIFIHYTD